MPVSLKRGGEDKIRIERSEAASSEMRMRRSGSLRNNQQAGGLLDHCRERAKGIWHGLID